MSEKAIGNPKKRIPIIAGNISNENASLINYYSMTFLKWQYFLLLRQ